VGVAARGRIDADNVGAARLYRPHTDVAPVPDVGAVDPTFSDEFNGSQLEPQWTWVREPDGEVANGVFRWPTQAADLFAEDNSASVALRRAPAGRYTAEVKVAIDLGVNTDRSFQQAGMVVYLNDDHHLRLTHVAIFNTRQTEFLKEMPFAGATSGGAMAVGTPAPVTWLRVSHRRDPNNGEHEFRAATSRDGERWIWGGTSTLPADTDPRIGLISLGKQDPDDPSATGQFDYFRVYRP
jgi:regulation of enolase protein 1 (concanavalin A-like superfamily)